MDLLKNKPLGVYGAIAICAVSVIVGVSSFLKSGIDTTLLDGNQFDVSKIIDINKDLASGKENVALANSPDLPDFLFNQYKDINIEGTLEDSSSQNEKEFDYLVKTSQFLLELELGVYDSNYYPAINQFFKSSSADYSKASLLWLNQGHSSEALSQVEESILANSVQHLTIKNIQDPLIEYDHIVSLYKKEKKKRSAFRMFEFSLLKSIWLKAHRETLTSTQNGSISIDNKLIQDFKKIRSNLNTTGDLIRLLNTQDTTLLITSAKVIRDVVPDNALHALRYHIVRNSNSKVRIALLDAFSVYGNKARVYETQLKQIMRLTDDEAVKQKVQLVLKQINGRA